MALNLDTTETGLKRKFFDLERILVSDLDELEFKNKAAFSALKQLASEIEKAQKTIFDAIDDVRTIEREYITGPYSR